MYVCRYVVFFFNLSSVFYRRRQWHPTPVLLPGKSHGWKSLVGCSLWGRSQSDTTERLHFHFSLSCIGEGNGNPLQCSCLENSRDGGAWWAAVYGVAQSRTRLKWLSTYGITRESNFTFGHVAPQFCWKNCHLSLRHVGLFLDCWFSLPACASPCAATTLCCLR